VVEFAKKSLKSQKYQRKNKYFPFFRINMALFVDLYGIIFWDSEKEVRQ